MVCLPFMAWRLVSTRESDPDREYIFVQDHMAIVKGVPSP